MCPLSQGTAVTGLRTIMAYRSGDHLYRRNYWSNPRLNLPESGTSLGVEDVSDNALVLTNNRFTYAATGDESGQCESVGGGGELSEGQEEFKSPNYPAAYPNNLDEVISSLINLTTPYVIVSPGTLRSPPGRGSSSPSKVSILRPILPVIMTMFKSPPALMKRNIVDPLSQVPSSAQETR